VIFIIVVLALSAGFFWYTKNSRNSNNQAWATYTQRLDSGDVISIDYPTMLAPVYRASVAGVQNVESSTGTHVNDINFNALSDKTTESISVTQGLPESRTAIETDKNSHATWRNTEPSKWHIGTWTAYEFLEPSFNGYSFNINGRNLSIASNELSESDLVRIMSSIRWNGVQMSKFDSMQNWDWPVLKTGK
jgi:hypothetical protein